MKKSEIMWFITGNLGLYCSGFQTRREAIAYHCHALGQTWDYCRAKGDRAIKCKVTPL